MENPQTIDSQASSSASPVSSPVSSVPGSAVANDLFSFDEKTTETVKWSAVWNVVAAVITSIVASVSAYFFVQSALSNLGPFGTLIGSGMTGASFINFGGLVRDVIFGAIFGAIGGFILAKFYNPLMDIQTKFLANKLNTLFKLLFWPRVVGAIVGVLLGLGAVGAFFGFMGVVVNFVGGVIAYFIYAKMMEKNVGRFYPSR